MSLRVAANFDNFFYWIILVFGIIWVQFKQWLKHEKDDRLPRGFSSTNFVRDNISHIGEIHRDGFSIKKA